MEKENSAPSVPIKRSGKQDRELKVLYALVEHYIKSGKPVGSHTLKEAEFEEISSATIRNYFARLEELGYLKQQHSSGGRIPTPSGFIAYAKNLIDTPAMYHTEVEELNKITHQETRKLSALLPQVTELLSLLTGHAAFISTPRYEHDFVTHLKVIPIDQRRALCAILTDFGTIQTEVMHTDEKLSAFSSKRIEEYFHFRLTGQDQPVNLDIEEEALGKRWYNELMTRHLILTTASDESGIYKTGFSKLLTADEEFDSAVVAKRLATFEHTSLLKRLLKEAIAHNTLTFWIGDSFADHSTFIAIPYYVQGQPVGALGLMGPLRLSYSHCFSLLTTFSLKLSDLLSKSLSKYKMTFKSTLHPLEVSKEQGEKIGNTDFMLLDNHTQGV